MPFATEEVSAFIDSVDRALVVEMNATAQLKGLIHKETEDYGDKLSSLLKYNGNPFEPREIVAGFEATINGSEFERSSARFQPAAGD
jgi:pyruvate ferredoxin oxidoreductase alpha subunit